MDMIKPHSWNEIWNLVQSGEDLPSLPSAFMGAESAEGFLTLLNTIVARASEIYTNLNSAHMVSEETQQWTVEQNNRLQNMENLIEKMMLSRELEYNPDVFNYWDSQNKKGILARVQAQRNTPVFEGARNFFHMISLDDGVWGAQNLPQVIGEEKMKYWLNAVNDQGVTPLQRYWFSVKNSLPLLDIVDCLNTSFANSNKPSSALARFSSTTNILKTVTLMVLETDPTVVDSKGKTSIAKYINDVKNDSLGFKYFQDVLEEIDKVILQNQLKHITAISSVRKM